MKQIGDLPNREARMIDGTLWVREIDCRANVNAALAQKKPLLKINADLVHALKVYNYAATKFITKCETGRARSVETQRDMRAARDLANRALEKA